MRRAGIKKIANQWSAALRVQISTTASLMCSQGLLLRLPPRVSPPLGSALPGSLSQAPGASPSSHPSPKEGSPLSCAFSQVTERHFRARNLGTPAPVEEGAGCGMRRRALSAAGCGAFCTPAHPLDRSSGVLREIITEPTQL